MQFTPRNVYKSTTSASGNVTTKEYSFEDYATLEVGSFFAILIGGAFFGVLIAPIFFLVSVFHFNGKNWLQFLGVGLISSYVILDITNHWLMWFFLDFGFSGSELKFLISMNGGLVFTSFFLCIFGSLIHNLLTRIFNKVESRWLIFIAIVVLLFWIGYNIFSDPSTITLFETPNSEVNLHQPEQHIN